MSFRIPSRLEVIALADCPKCGAVKGATCDQPEHMAKQRKGSLVPNHRDRVKAAQQAMRK